MLGYSTFNPLELIRLVNSVRETFLFKLETVFPKDVRTNNESKIQIEQEVHLQSVHFFSAYSTNFGIVGVANKPAIHRVIYE